MCLGKEKLIHFRFEVITTSSVSPTPVSYKARGLTNRGDRKEHYPRFWRVSGRQRDMEVTEF